MGLSISISDTAILGQNWPLAGTMGAVCTVSLHFEQFYGIVERSTESRYTASHSIVPRSCMSCSYPIDERCRVSARLEYENGEAYEWSSPRWSQLSLFTKKRLFRIQEYMDGIRSDDHVLLHFPLVEYIARTNPIHVEYPYGRPQQLYPKRVVLSGHQTLIYPPPEDYDSRIQPGFHWLLGNPVKDTLGEETSEELYWWTVPDNYDFRSKRPVPPIHGSTLTKLPSSTTRPQIDDSQEDPGSDGPTDGWQMDDD